MPIALYRAEGRGYFATEASYVENDRQLIERCRRGDEHALAELVGEYRDMVHGLAYHMLHDAEAASDAAQESFLSVFRALPGFRGDSAVALRTWIYRIARNECIQRSDRARRWRFVRTLANDDETSSVAGDEPSPLDDTVAARRSDRVRRAVSTLREPYRSVIVLRYFEDLPYAEIARILDATLGSVKSWLYRAKVYLADALVADAEVAE